MAASDAENEQAFYAMVYPRLDGNRIVIISDEKCKVFEHHEAGEDANTDAFNMVKAFASKVVAGEDDTDGSFTKSDGGTGNIHFDEAEIDYSKWGGCTNAACYLWTILSKGYRSPESFKRKSSDQPAGDAKRMATELVEFLKTRARLPELRKCHRAICGESASTEASAEGRANLLDAIAKAVAQCE